MRPFSSKVTNAVNRDDGKLSEGYKYRSVVPASSKNGTILALSYMHDDSLVRSNIRVMS